MSEFEYERVGGIRYLGAVVRDHWPLILITLVLGVGTAAALSLSAKKSYEAGADILVTPISSTDDSFLGTNLVRDTGDPSRSVLTVARLVKTPEVADRVRAKLDLGLSRDQVLQLIDVKPVSQANVVTIAARQPNPTRAARLANAFADAFIAQRTAEFQTQVGQTINQLRRRLDGIPPDQRGPERTALEDRLGALSPFVGGSDPTVQISTRAVPPTSPVSPRPVLTVVVAILAALFLGVGAALASEQFGTRVTREDELLLGQRLPILARVPETPGTRAHNSVAGQPSGPTGAWEAAYRNLRWNIAGSAGDAGFPRTIVVTSATPNDGKTTTVANLAVTLATAGVSVIAVDGDLYHPMLGSVFAVPASQATGFADLFLAASEPQVHLVDAPGHEGSLRLLLGAPDQVDFTEGLEPRRVERALDRLKQEADIIIVDSPALTDVPDGVVLASAVDAVLVAVWLGRTRRDRLTELRRILAQHRISPVGFVVTSRKRSATKGYYPRRRPRPASQEPSIEPTQVPSLTFDVEQDKT